MIFLVEAPKIRKINMVNVLGLCKYLRDNYPIPAPPSEINASIAKYLGHEVSPDVQVDAVKALTVKWKRDGWAWAETGAVKLYPKEEALFHVSGVTIFSVLESDPSSIRYFPIKLGYKHERVVWF